jgi:hypothetical protein
MARPMPLQFTEGDQTIAREGYVSLTVIPRTLNESSSEKSSFDKEKKLSVKLRAKQIGQLLTWKMVNGAKLAPLTINAYMTGSVPATLELKYLGTNPEEPEVQLTITPKAGDMGAVSMPISFGEIKSFQVLLEACLPELYGWTSKNTAPKIAGTWSKQSATETKSPEDFFNQFK